VSKKTKARLKPYLVTWSIDVEAHSYEEAARLAQEIQRDRDSIATVFNVRCRGREQLVRIIDLEMTESMRRGGLTYG
jgi:hypothetical protein